MKTALITGISGQDGSYLSEFLLNKGYTVHGIVRRSSLVSRTRLDNMNSQFKGQVKLHYGDLTDVASIVNLVLSIKPDEIYNLGAQSHVKISFDVPEYTAQATGIGTLNLLDAVRISGLKPRIYQAGSSEMFGKVQEVPQKETTPFYPRSPYGAAKVYAHWIAVNYRESYNMFVSNGILFNHESPRRGENFVTRKITLGAAAIKLGLKKDLELGNLHAKRDWGYAKDYVEAMWAILNHNEPDDFVIATGETYSVEEFCAKTFGYLELDYKKYVKINPKYNRPAEVDLLIGDPSKAKRILGWQPKTSIDQLVKIMVDSDMEMLTKNKGYFAN
jgi:GDPmannose 4,6-dehydratase